MIRYFVNFVQKGSLNAGSTEIHLEKPIRSIKDVIYVQDLLAGEGVNVIILGFQRFEEESQ